MKLITEVFNEDCSVLTEASEDGKKNYYIEGTFMQSDVKNRNGRVYPSAILEKEMNRYKKDFIETKRALGELGHPDGPQINGDRVSHLITEMNRDGSNFVGKAKIMGTPMGEIVKTFIDEGVKVGVSTRGLGSVKPGRDGIMEVQNDFHLATVDVVTDPSGPDCFVKGIMENTEYYFDIATASWKEGSFNDIQENVGDALAEEYKAQMDIAMKMIEDLQNTVKQLKRNHKPRTKIDEQKAAQLFENFINTIKQK